MANCRASSGPSGSGCAIEPIVLIAAGTLGIWASSKAKTSHHQLASRSSSAKLLDVEVAEDGDQRVRGDRQQRQVEHRAGGDAAQLDQRLLLGAEQRAQPVAHVVELDVGVVEGVADVRSHRRLLQVRQHRQQAIVAQRAASDAPRTLLADQQHERAEQLGLVVAGVAGRLGHRGGRQIAEPERPVGPHDEAIEVELAVDDPGTVQSLQLAPQPGDRPRR